MEIPAKVEKPPTPSDPRYITPAIRVVDTDRHWIIQTAVTKRTKRHTKPTGEWIERAYITSRTMLNRELQRLVGKGALQNGLIGHVEQDVLDWLNSLPVYHPARAAAPKPSLIETLETLGPEHHTAYDLRDDIPLVIEHGPLRFRDKWNARYDV